MINGFLKGAVVGLLISLFVLVVFSVPLLVLAIVKYLEVPWIFEPIAFFASAIITITSAGGLALGYVDTRRL